VEAALRPPKAGRGYGHVVYIHHHLLGFLVQHIPLMAENIPPDGQWHRDVAALGKPSAADHPYFTLLSLYLQITTNSLENQGNIQSLVI